MAKAPAKKTTTAAKPVAAKKTSAKKETAPMFPEDVIESVSVSALTKLKALNLEPQLQADIEWCLGSYSHDKNPVGLFEMTERALSVFKSELTKKTKGVTAKFIAELEKAVKPS